MSPRGNAAAQSTRPALEVESASVEFFGRSARVRAVDNVSFALGEGEALAVVGESGSGKSTLALSVMGLLPDDSTEVSFASLVVAGKRLMLPTPRDLEQFRGTEIAMVFQDPLTALNPVMTIGSQLEEPLRYHKGLGRRAARLRAIELLEAVGIPQPEKRLNAYPHQFSGGMRQRVVIGMALAAEPRVLIADEPTTALDATVQAEIVDLISGLRRDLGLAVLWITHDLALMAEFADRVMVMYGGKVVEMAPTADLFANPRHPYTQALIRSAPTLDLDRSSPLWTLKGAPPPSADAVEGCSFRTRCWRATGLCYGVPHLAPKESVHQSACWNPGEMPVEPLREPSSMGEDDAPASY